MTPSTSPGSQLGPLNPGDVVSAGIRLYRDRFQTFFQLAALAMVWLIGGVIGLMLSIVLFAGLLTAVGGELLGVLGGLLGAAIGFLPLLYGSAKYYMLSSVIGRLSFRDLLDQPEVSLQARRQVAPKLGQFLLLGVVLLLAYMAAYLIGTLAALIAGGALGFLTAGILSALINEAVGGVVGVLLGLMLGGAILLISLIWIAARLFIAEVVLAIEPNQDAGGSMGRSWDLTSGSVVRIQVVFLATFLIQIPIVMVTNYIPTLLIELLPGNTAFSAIATALGLVLSLVGSIFVLPLWQAVKGVLYYDLRSRREGLDLELRHSSN
ncbi:hypothetical protein [Nodosilinea sp. P-1105]|uniref:hypothetical protein n=1 Tax=Nodosilinea sp. P-1105 TaxID=2546229 RepID=UPI00146D1035|nr:hypothetical protein [Nodosilinea sp. P-1105]NMF83125.1 hypothetical protein [Nodosilinea sp. P-1105]